MYLRNGVYYSDFRDKNGKRYRKNLRTSDAITAAAKEREFKRSVTSFNPKKDEILLWEDYKKWFFDYLRINKSEGTAYWHNLALRYFEQFFIPKYAREITPSLLLKFKAFMIEKSRQNHNKPGISGRNRVIRAMKTMLYTGAKYEIIGVNVNFRGIEKEKNENDGRVVFHTLEELTIIGQALKPLGDLFTVFCLGWEEGLRRGEIAFLEKEDYNPFNHTISIRAKKEWIPKTKKSVRTIPLTPHCEAAVRESIFRNTKSKYIINLPGNRLDREYLSTTYRKTVNKLTPYKSFLHKLRHTYGTLLVQKGVPIKIVCNLMGHSSVLQTEKYVHLGQNEYLSAMQNIPKIEL